MNIIADETANQMADQVGNRTVDRSVTFLFAYSYIELHVST